MISPTLHEHPGAKAAFTLVEVMLAIVIALAILVVLLYFYQQATGLRAEAIGQTEQISAIRLLMDRITTELRSTPSRSPFGHALVGTSNSIQFVKVDVPALSAWTGSPLGRASSPNSDLRLIRYQLQSTDGTTVAGLLRTEQPAALLQQLEPVENGGTNDLSNAAFRPLVEEIRYLQFRYWSGSNWLDGWSSPTPPRGIEVSLAAEPLTNGTDSVDYPVEIFRRVICLSSTLAAAPAETDTSSSLSSPGTEEVP